jgi:AcrR family transcriptional regulator
MAKIISSDKGTKREVIIQKAAQLFKSKSYTAASMRELAETLGVEAPSLYNHIGSKSELLQAICFKVGNQFTSQIDKIENSRLSAIKKIRSHYSFSYSHHAGKF